MNWSVLYCTNLKGPFPTVGACMKGCRLSSSGGTLPSTCLGSGYMLAPKNSRNELGSTGALVLTSNDFGPRILKPSGSAVRFPAALSPARCAMYALRLVCVLGSLIVITVNNTSSEVTGRPSCQDALGWIVKVYVCRSAPIVH